jgi:peptidoglycan/LPS O-acetylase OafA/YrhL
MRNALIAAWIFILGANAALAVAHAAPHEGFFVAFNVLMVAAAPVVLLALFSQNDEDGA